MSGSNCCFLTCILISQESGKVVWYSHPLKKFPVYCDPKIQGLWPSQWSRSRCFFLEFSYFFYDPMDVGNLISGSSAFSKSSLYICKFSFQVMLKLARRILNITLLACEMSAVECSLNIPWHCLSLGFKWRLTFSSTVAIAEFSKFASILSAALSQHHLLDLK